MISFTERCSVSCFPAASAVERNRKRCGRLNWKYVGKKRTYCELILAVELISRNMKFQARQNFKMCSK